MLSILMSFYLFTEWWEFFNYIHMKNVWGMKTNDEFDSGSIMNFWYIIFVPSVYTKNIPIDHHS